MTNQELNRDIKRLVKDCESIHEPDINQRLRDIQVEKCRKEFHRLYHADTSFTSVSKQNILYMLRLNIRYRFIELHSFGIHINLPNEK